MRCTFHYKELSLEILILLVSFSLPEFQVHLAASECLLEMVSLWKKSSPLEGRLPFMEELAYLCEVERNEQAKSLLLRCLADLQNLGQ